MLTDKISYILICTPIVWLLHTTFFNRSGEKLLSNSLLPKQKGIRDALDGSCHPVTISGSDVSRANVSNDRLINVLLVV